jgi:hypothetical protein
MTARPLKPLISPRRNGRIDVVLRKGESFVDAKKEVMRMIE